MTLSPITIPCPNCGSTDVFYSCKPECCFNHVCNQCYTTFELETTRVGEVTEEFVPPSDLDPTSPTAPCARCGECRVFALTRPQEPAPAYVCAACRALLTLALTNVVKG